MLQVFDCDQGGTEWFEARRGIPTASMFATIMASGKGGGTSLTRAKYMRELVGERITGEVVEGYSNSHMERGKAMESEARDLYAFVKDAQIHRVGFVRNGKKGASPDSLIDKAGALEIKTALPHILVETIAADRAPPEHTAQCQGVLWVTERDWIDLVVYWPKMPLFLKRLHRDEEYIAKMSAAVALFNEETDALEVKIRSHLNSGALAAA